MTVPSNLLKGRYFHTLRTEYNQEKKDFITEIERQGIVLGSPEPEWYLVQYFSWLDGSPTNQVLVKFSEMTRWNFYDDADSMAQAYQKEQMRRSK